MVTLNIDNMDKFRNLQLTLKNRWKTSELFDNSEADILIIPSLSIDQRELLKVEGCEHYEERLLFSLIRLRNPRTRLIYITSMPLHPSIIDYYLQLLPGIPFSHARHRLLLLSTY
ncbi:MAG: carboxylate-amine ligase, partial [Dolichospermum sp.]